MDNSWKFTDLEFVVLWEEGLKEQCLPKPLMFTSRTPMWNDYLAERAEVQDGLRATLDPGFDEVLADIHQPDIRIEVRGWDARDWDDAAGHIRLLATRRGDRGFLITQIPGETVYHSSGFTVTECAAVELADMVVKALPDIGPGRRSETLLVERGTGDADYSYGRSVVQDSFDGSVGDRAAAFMAVPASATGRIDIIQARSIFGPRGMTRHRLKWRDLEEDGRYLIDDRNPPVAAAIDRRQLVSAINIRIAEIVRVVKDERV